MKPLENSNGTTIEEKLDNGHTVSLSDIPPQFRGMTAEALKEIWVNPENVQIKVGESEEYRLNEINRRKEIVALLEVAENKYDITNSSNQKLEVKKSEYVDLVNDFGVFITLNAAKLEHQILPGNEEKLLDLRQVLRKPIINGLSYSDFIFQNPNKLTNPEVSQAVISQIYNFLKYIEPRLSIFKPDSLWVTRFESIKQKYIGIVSSN